MFTRLIEMDFCLLIGKNIIEENVLSSGGFSVVNEGRLINMKVVVKKTRLTQSTKQELLHLQRMRNLKLPIFIGVYDENYEKTSKSRVITDTAFKADSKYIPNNAINNQDKCGFNEIFDEKKKTFSSINIVLQKIKGQTLNLFMGDYSSFTFVKYLLIADLCDIILYLHNLNLIHKDIKPKNIMIDENDISLKLLDFGISVKSDDQGMTTSDAGTLNYMSPEFIPDFDKHGQLIPKIINEKSDVWGIGLILSEFFSNEKPWSSLIRFNSYEVTNFLYKKVEFPIPTSIKNPFEREFVKQCTSYSCEKRFSSKDAYLFSLILLFKEIKNSINSNSEKEDKEKDTELVSSLSNSDLHDKFSIEKIKRLSILFNIFDNFLEYHCLKLQEKSYFAGTSNNKVIVDEKKKECSSSKQTSQTSKTNKNSFSYKTNTSTSTINISNGNDKYLINSSNLKSIPITSHHKSNKNKNRTKETNNTNNNYKSNTNIMNIETETEPEPKTSNKTNTKSLKIKKRDNLYNSIDIILDKEVNANCDYLSNHDLDGKVEPLLVKNSQYFKLKYTLLSRLETSLKRLYILLKTNSQQIIETKNKSEIMENSRKHINNTDKELKTLSNTSKSDSQDSIIVDSEINNEILNGFSFNLKTIETSKPLTELASTKAFIHEDQSTIITCKDEFLNDSAYSNVLHTKLARKTHQKNNSNNKKNNKTSLKENVPSDNSEKNEKNDKNYTIPKEGRNDNNIFNQSFETKSFPNHYEVNNIPRFVVHNMFYKVDNIGIGSVFEDTNSYSKTKNSCFCWKSCEYYFFEHQSNVSTTFKQKCEGKSISTNSNIIPLKTTTNTKTFSSFISKTNSGIIIDWNEILEIRKLKILIKTKPSMYSLLYNNEFKTFATNSSNNQDTNFTCPLYSEDQSIYVCLLSNRQSLLFLNSDFELIRKYTPSCFLTSCVSPLKQDADKDTKIFNFNNSNSNQNQKRNSQAHNQKQSSGQSLVLSDKVCIITSYDVNSNNKVIITYEITIDNKQTNNNTLLIVDVLDFSETYQQIKNYKSIMRVISIESNNKRDAKINQSNNTSFISNNKNLNQSIVQNTHIANKQPKGFHDQHKEKEMSSDKYYPIFQNDLVLIACTNNQNKTDFLLFSLINKSKTLVCSNYSSSWDKNLIKAHERSFLFFTEKESILNVLDFHEPRISDSSVFEFKSSSKIIDVSIIKNSNENKNERRRIITDRVDDSETSQKPNILLCVYCEGNITKVYNLYKESLIRNISMIAFPELNFNNNTNKNIFHKGSFIISINNIHSNTSMIKEFYLFGDNKSIKVYECPFILNQLEKEKQFTRKFSSIFESNDNKNGHFFNEVSTLNDSNTVLNLREQQMVIFVKNNNCIIIMKLVEKGNKNLQIQSKDQMLLKDKRVNCEGTDSDFLDKESSHIVFSIFNN